MKSLWPVLFLVVLFGCAQTQNGSTDPGAQGSQGYGAGIFASIAPAASCPAGSNGGTQFTTFIDRNNDGLLSSGETVTSISVVCGGLTGEDGRDGVDGVSSSISVSLADLTTCPEGGYVFKTQTGSDLPVYTPVCNGDRGTQGIQGLQGPQGEVGIPGTQVTPVKFCKTDHSDFPEYGLLIGHQLFGVYWGTAPFSNGANEAFLALLTPGSYRSTGGNGCSFVINSNNTVSP